VKYSYDPKNAKTSLATLDLSSGRISLSLFQSGVSQENDQNGWVGSGGQPVPYATYNFNTNILAQPVYFSSAVISPSRKIYINTYNINRITFISDRMYVIDLAGPNPSPLPFYNRTFPSLVLNFFENSIIHRENTRSTKIIWKDLDSWNDYREEDLGIDWVSQSKNELNDTYYFHQQAVIEEEPTSSGIYFAKIPVAIFRDDFNTREDTELRFQLPNESPSIQEYVEHLHGETQLLDNTRYVVRKRIAPLLHYDGDQNDDGQIDVSDLIIRVNELNSQATTTIHQTNTILQGSETSVDPQFGQIYNVEPCRIKE
jgi:hypothetical protein